MREGTSKHLALLAVELYEISEEFIYNLREAQHPRQDVFEHLPEFTINKNEGANNQPIVAKYYHQFVGALRPEKKEKYLYFNLSTQDNILHEEISNSGMEDLFQGFDFEKLLSKFKPEPEKKISGFVIPHIYYLVVELVYTTSQDHYSGGYDCDMDIDVVGYLDYNLQRQPFEIPKRSDNAFKAGDKVKLPFREKGEIVEYIDLPWASRYNVKITESNGFNNVGEIHDYFESQLELIKK